MSQYISRIHIKVSSPKVWSRFQDKYDAEFELAALADTNATSFIIDGEWSVFEDELEGIVGGLSKILDKNGIIIADTNNINVDPYNYCILYLGSRVRTKYFNGEFEARIDNIPDWLNYGGFRISKEEKEVLFRCEVAQIKGVFTKFSTELKLPERICLRETSFKNRLETIENTSVGEEVYFVHSKDSLDPLRLEVMSYSGSLGYLPSDVSDMLAPILKNKRLRYTARVNEAVPASNRNRHAKSSIVSIGIEVEWLPV